MEYFLGEDRISAIVDLYDENVKLNALLDAVDGAILRKALNYLDQNYLASFIEKNISSDVQSLILNLVDNAINKDWDEVCSVISNFANGKLDIPYVDEDAETLLFNAIAAVLQSVITNVTNGTK